jgi:DNA-binding CsgD family transcriptional regulator
MRIEVLVCDDATARVPSSALRRVIETADADYVRATWRSVPFALASETPGIDKQPGWARIRAMGFADIVAINGVDPSGRGVFLGSLVPRRIRFGTATREKWARVAAHMAAGLRVRRALASTQHGRPDITLEAEGVLTTDGKLQHGEAAAVAAREALRRAVLALERARGPLRRRDSDGAIAEWRGLIEARWSLIDHFESDGKRYLVARRNEPRVAGFDALSIRERQVVGYVGFGHSNKLIAYELGISHSTVRVLVARSMAKLGAKSRAELSAVVAKELESKRTAAPVVSARDV